MIIKVIPPPGPYDSINFQSIECFGKLVEQRSISCEKNGMASIGFLNLPYRIENAGVHKWLSEKVEAETSWSVSGGFIDYLLKELKVHVISTFLTRAVLARDDQGGGRPAAGARQMEVGDRRYSLHDVTGAMGEALKDLRRSSEGSGDERPLNRYMEAVVRTLKALPPGPPRTAQRSD